MTSRENDLDRRMPGNEWLIYFPPINIVLLLLNMADDVCSPAKKRRKTDKQDVDHRKGETESGKSSAKRTGETYT